MTFSLLPGKHLGDFSHWLSLPQCDLKYSKIELLLRWTDFLNIRIALPWLDSNLYPLRHLKTKWESLWLQFSDIEVKFLHWTSTNTKFLAFKVTLFPTLFNEQLGWTFSPRNYLIFTYVLLIFWFLKKLLEIHLGTLSHLLRWLQLAVKTSLKV